jgi:DNA-directed RNA polymerase subunit E'/Rpb7
MGARDINDIKNRALTKIRTDLEGVCGNYGYVKRVRYIDTIEFSPLINCTSGLGEFNLSLSVHMTRCLPIIGQEIVCNITGSEKSLGTEISQHGPFIIFILTERMDAGWSLESIDEKLCIGDKVRVRVLKTELKKGETKPTIIASLITKV